MTNWQNRNATKTTVALFAQHYKIRVPRLDSAEEGREPLQDMAEITAGAGVRHQRL